jgi:hypothetical protein
MTRRLDSTTASSRPSDSAFESRMFAVFTALSTALFFLVGWLWAVSYLGTTPAFTPGTNHALGPPRAPHILIPLPSDYPQYWVPLNGNLERWENGGAMGGGWFRWHRGIPLWTLAVVFALLPSAWVIGKWNRRPTAAGEPAAAADRGRT